MEYNFLDLIGVNTFFEKLKSMFATKAVATTSTDGLMSKDMVTKINNIENSNKGCLSELMQIDEPIYQEKGNYWVQEYN